MSSIKDPKGNSIFPNPKGICEAAFLHHADRGCWQLM
jgi:hypothetical protein